MSIQVKALTKIYGQQKAIDNISFEAHENEILGLLGPNGAGKTTTMKILTCFMPPSSGEAYVCGMDVMKNELEVRRSIGYLPEHNPLYGSMYVREFLQFVCKIHDVDNIKNRVNDCIERVGLGRESNKQISELSKGYKQRVGLAQAIIHDPKVLILDEPISGLDPNQLVEIRTLIAQLKKDKTIIFSSHILQEVESVCDRVVILDKGKLVADDNMKGNNLSLNTIQEIEVQFLNNINPDHLRKAIKPIEIEIIKGNKYLVRSSSKKDIRSEIFDYAVASSNKLLEMKLRSASLENIFKSVTKS